MSLIAAAGGKRQLSEKQPPIDFKPVLFYTIIIMNNPFTIMDIKNRITETAQRYGVQKVYLYGSYARGEAEIESDIDICIEKGKIRTLFELSGFCRDLEESLGNKVDVITTTALSEDFKNRIEKDMILLYE